MILYMYAAITLAVIDTMRINKLYAGSDKLLEIVTANPGAER